MIGAERILVLGAHPDDGEFGCGGTIARLRDEGKSVWYAVFSLCEESIPAHLPRNVLQGELGAACRVLGIPDDHIITMTYPVRRFPESRQEILEQLVAVTLHQFHQQLVFQEVANHLVLVALLMDRNPGEHDIALALMKFLQA